MAKRKVKKKVRNQVEGLSPVNPEAVARIAQTMEDDVIPEIVKAVEERRLRAAENRHSPLKC